ncbi:MAG: hypothetical protein F4107_00045 [Gemmatimonadetes bacterium]|nr:hypothetical protein [Gemmatimonadota bacterium]MYI64317.1 hypothetical protein [Gemmatimonadota bacterium]
MTPFGFRTATRTNAPTELRYWTWAAALGALAFAPACSSPIPDTDDCESRELAVKRFAEATVALESVARAAVFEAQRDRGLTASPNAFAEILADAGLDSAAVRAAFGPEDAARIMEAEARARSAYTAGDFNDVEAAAKVVLDVLLEQVEAVGGVEARNSVRPAVDAMFWGRVTRHEEAELRAMADSVVRTLLYKAALEIREPYTPRRDQRNPNVKTEAYLAIRAALEASVQSVMECLE